MLYGRDENHELLWKNFAFSKVISCKYIGRHKIELVNLINKTRKVAIENSERREVFSPQLNVQKICLYVWFIGFVTIEPYANPIKLNFNILRQLMIH